MPAISVIIPIYNVEKYLRRCLDSVLNQTFSDWQAICVNDGSPDNSAAILSEYAAKDSRFKIVNKENGGLSDARNAGMQHATGDYILYLDSDDFIHPQTMEIAYYLAQRDGADIVSFTYVVPAINIYQGVLLWGIFAIIGFIINDKKRFLVAYKNPAQLSEEEMKKLMERVKLQSQARMLNSMIINAKDYKDSKDLKVVENKENIEHIEKENSDNQEKDIHKV